MSTAQQMLDSFVEAARERLGHGATAEAALELPEARAMLEAAPETRAALAVLVVQELCPPRGKLGGLIRSLTGGRDYLTDQRLKALLTRLLRASLPFSEEQLLEVMGSLTRLEQTIALGALTRAVERHVAEHGASPALRRGIQSLTKSLWFEIQASAETRRTCERLALLLADGEAPAHVHPGIWGDNVLAWLAALEERAPWDALLGHAMQAAGKSRPSQKWARQAVGLVEAIGVASFSQQLQLWMESAKLGWTSQPGWGPKLELGMSDHNQDLLKGLVWAAASLDDEGLARAVGRFGERCYRKIKDFGPASKKLGNACLHALSEMPNGAGVAHLSRLAGKVRYASGRAQVERALSTAAERAGQSRADIEELAVPDFGLDPAGVRRVPLGEHTAELAIRAGEVSLGWLRVDGKRQRSVPRAVKEGHAEALKQIKKQAKELKELLEGQAGRLQRLWLEDRRLPLGALRARYLEHPVVGQLARRLLWAVDDPPNGTVEVIWRDGRLVTLGGEPVALPDEAEARLWHILDIDTDDEAQLQRLLVWRDHLDGLQLRQPFKQLWREVYRPLEPRAAGDRRFAGHILRQHPFLNLCQTRGWQYTIQGYWDSHNYPTRRLERWGVQASLEVDPVDHKKDDFIFNYLVTGELRFHAVGDGVLWDHPLTLEEVPPVVFSEVLRDVDLFVGVSSVANEPGFSAADIKQSWRTYWTDNVWGELAPLARTRRDVLARVLPRTTLRERAALEDRWLVVRGETDRYRVHLGTANVRRDDSDLPLEVTPDRRARDHVASVFLPFEGDSVLATILARAFMLAER